MTANLSARTRSVSAALIVLAVIGFASTASAQEMSISEYHDIFSDGDTVFGYLDWVDNSTGCNHSNYTLQTDLSGPTGYSSSGGNSAALSFEEGDYTVDGELSFYCDCYQDAVYVYGSSLTWHLSIKQTYYTNVETIPLGCWYYSTACSSGTPSCTAGVGFALFPPSVYCPNYAKALWVVAQRGTSVTCFTNVTVGALGGGACF
jgi:hypothetical protein